MPTLDAAIIAGKTSANQRVNFTVDIQTAVPRRLTRYRGFTAENPRRRGFIVAAVFYATADVVVPGIDESDSFGPETLTVTLGNAKNVFTDLVSDAANVRKRITITRIHFNDDAHALWRGSPPTLRGTPEPWFDGFIVLPSFRGEYVDLQCDADDGRRGSSPRTRSRTLMTSHVAVSERKLKVRVQV